MANRDEAGRYLPAHSIPGPGRSTDYDPSMNDVARKLSLLGLIDEELAEFFGVTPQTIYNWYQQWPAFFEAVQEGKTIADANVAESLYKRATGEFVEVQKLVKDPTTGTSTVIKLKTFVPGDAGAALNWLKNRKADKWRDKQDVTLNGALNVQIIRLADDPTSSK